MLFPALLYNLDRDRERKALYDVMPYRPEHFALLAHVAVSYRGRTESSKVQLKPGLTPLAHGTRVAEINLGFEMDTRTYLIKRLGRVVSSKVRHSTVLWATEYNKGSESTKAIRYDPPKETQNEDNVWLAVLIDNGPVDTTQLLVDFGPDPPVPPRKKRKAPVDDNTKKKTTPKAKKARKE